MKHIKKRYLLLISIILVGVLGFVILNSMSSPLTKAEMNEKIDKDINEMAEKNNQITSAILTVYSDKLGLNETYSAGSTGKDLSEKVTPDHPYYSASIGKTFTATLISMLCDDGIIDLNNNISQYLGDDLLDGLFVHNGTDYKNQVTIKQLLGHTSGIGDYYEDAVLNGDPMTELLIKDPNKLWSPLELIEFTRDNQRAVAPPGEEFHYSDTGYIILGFLIEEVTGKEFHQVLHERILNPLEMDDTYLNFKSNPMNPQIRDILEVYLEGQDVSNHNSLSFDWSGGGLITTMDDLLTFSRALHQNQLVTDTYYNQMTDFRSKYSDGVYYGLGIMEFRFGELSYFLKDLPNMYGGVGDSSTFMLYDKTRDIHIIANFGSVGFMEESVTFLAKVLMMVDRLIE